jgi:hypothetical protein
MVPVRSLPDASATVVPLPSLNPYAIVGPLVEDGGGVVVKIAVTEMLVFVRIVQAPVPEQPPPLHPPNVEPELVVAARVTVVPLG